MCVVDCGICIKTASVCVSGSLAAACTNPRAKFRAADYGIYAHDNKVMSISLADVRLFKFRVNMCFAFVRCMLCYIV